MEGDAIPIALRRTPRRSINEAAPKLDGPSLDLPRPSIASSKTPSKSRTKKRVRFSDPGPDVVHMSPSSTGLTPMVRRSSLGGAPSPKRRRNSTPARSQINGDEDADELANEVYFPSLRQVLDDRVKRRIRRNGLSAEMNVINEEKRRESGKQKGELQRLRDELAEKDQEIERLRDATTIQDNDRIAELEQQIEALQQELNGRSDPIEQSRFDWTLAARDPFSDSYMDDDEGFGDTTMADFECSTPSRARASFPTPPCTSPTIPATPTSIRRQQPPTPSSSHSAVQVCLEDPEKEALEEELGSLRLELTKLTEAIEDHESLKSRIAEKLAAAKTPSSERDDITAAVDVETHLNSVLQSLADRTAALMELNSSLTALGFSGRDACEVVASMASALRSARLELEYLTPGEIALPLTSHGAEVLDLLLTRLRDLARKVQEDEETIDEYHALELSLRQQLGARVEVTDNLRREVQRSAGRLRERDERITELEIGTDRLKGAVEAYRRDVTELETLVQRLEDQGHSEAEAAAAEAEARVRTELEASGKQELSRRDDCIAALEGKLAASLAQIAELRIQLAGVQASKAEGEAEAAAASASLNRTHGRALALRDARVAELRREIDLINASLRSAHETIRQLRVENGKLAGGAEAERERSQAAIEALKAELERVKKASEQVGHKVAAAAPMQPRRSSRRSAAAMLVAVELEDQAAVLSGKNGRSKRRRYDSGLGISDGEGEEEVEA
ncbi:hypothetical protein BX600DRAFT_432918 [Xylariales sp. PMI_506]|nr:hypothetical protein BX600DRAFT_432918 [Xylariales sp. PMI_506]